MQFKKREKILAIAAGTALALLAGWLLLGGGEGPSRGRLRADYDRLAADVDKKRVRVQAAQNDAARMAEWERLALPADRANARSLYQSWLRDLAHRAGLRQLDVQSGEGQSRKDVYTMFSFTVRGRATLAQLARLLYDFYSAGHLHQVRRLDVKPAERSGELDVTMAVEALSLPGADRKDRLSQQQVSRLKPAGLADYAGVIVKRNLFAPYTPENRKPSSNVDPCEYTFVTAILEVDGRRQVWLGDRMAGKTLKLGEGEAFDVGGSHGVVKTIGLRDVVLEIAGRSRRLTYGDNLVGGVEVP